MHRYAWVLNVSFTFASTSLARNMWTHESASRDR